MWIEMHSLMLLAAALLPWEQSLSWWVDLGTNCASHLDAKSPEVDWWLRDTRPAFYIQQLKAMERRMAWQVVVRSSMAGARLDRVIEDTSTIYFRRRVYRRCPLLIAATNQSELSLILGDCPKKWQVKFFWWRGSCFFLLQIGSNLRKPLKTKNVLSNLSFWATISKFCKILLLL